MSPSKPTKENDATKKNSSGTTTTRNTTSTVARQRKKKKRGTTAGTGLNDMFIAVFGIAFILSLSLNIMHMLKMDGTTSSTGGDSSSSSTTMKSRNGKKLPRLHEGSAVHRAMQAFMSSSSDNISNINIGRKKSNSTSPPPRKVVEPTTRSQEIDEEEKDDGTGRQQEEQEDYYNTRQDDLPPEMRLGAQQQQEQQQRKDESQKHDNNNDNINNPLMGGLATLDCQVWGGPSAKAAQEMVYWQDIPSDSKYVSPFYKTNQQQTSQSAIKYLTFEPDGGGW
jgi:hypothetical protein